jgi:tRNA-specific 2-thiouridylase
VDDAGRPFGEHRGLMYYTLGQRRGLAIGGQRGAKEAPWYVVAKVPARNALVVSQEPDHPLLMSRRVHAAPFHWIRPLPRPEAPLLARIRHRQALQPCTASLGPDGEVLAQFEAPQRAAVAGQYLVLYDGEECLGGGEISCADHG